MAQVSVTATSATAAPRSPAAAPSPRSPGAAPAAAPNPAKLDPFANAPVQASQAGGHALAQL